MPTVNEGDCFVSLAAEAGIRDYKLLVDHGPNSGVKQNRPNPNMLVKGDVVEVPDGKTKKETKAVDKTWTFEVKALKPPKLLIILLDKDDKPLGKVKWKLVGSQTVEGKTKKDGKIEIEQIPPTEKTATLHVTLPAGKDEDDDDEFGPTGDDAYPPEIDPDHFPDEWPEQPDRTEVEWTLSIGGLPSHNDKSGVQARLRNLGFGCKVGADDKTTERAVKAYQLVHKKEQTGSGKWADIQDDIKDRHEKP